jgi:hypothetical protein
MQSSSERHAGNGHGHHGRYCKVRTERYGMENNGGGVRCICAC